MRDLFLIDFGGMQYGVWKDETLSVKDIDALHRIPLSPAYIAGFMIADRQTVTVADLPWCIGQDSTPETDQGSILLVKAGEALTGFLARGQMHTQTISPQSVFPLPAYLKTAVFDACAIHRNQPIPLVKISALHSRALKGDAEFSVDARATYTAQPQDISEIEQLRFFHAGGDRYAASAAGMDSKTYGQELIAPLPNVPEYVNGIVFLNGLLLPVIDLAWRINAKRATQQAMMLIVEIAEAKFGLLVDSDDGKVPANQVTLKPLPLIAQNTWFKHAVLRAGQIIPLVDLGMALSSAAPLETPICDRYTPDSGFAAQFFKQDVEIVEFSLLGERHALPKGEVEEVIACKPCQALPGVPPIVIGVAEHNGEILPVLDLAMIFGRRSITTPTSRMTLLCNGDFRALLITEAVYAVRKLPPDTHRAVPIHLPHHLLYGCYPDEKAVRLILNVAAIAVHFEESLIQHFLPSLSSEMKMRSTEGEPDVALPEGRSASEPADRAAQEQQSLTGEIRDEAAHEQALAQATKVSPRKGLAASSKKTPKFKHPPRNIDDASPAWESEIVAVPAIPADRIVTQQATAAADVAVEIGATSMRHAAAEWPASEEHAPGGWLRPFVFGAIALVLALLFFYVDYSDKAGTKKSVTVSAPENAQPAKVHSALPASAAKRAAPLELNIPKNMPVVDSDVYVVVLGDTLWSISARFTGNPFNYPRIAGENKVADPDLIFPGQRIRLIK
jgi:chemotaxis signal transduction protein/nucleoid-associated protein YgaU